MKDLHVADVMSRRVVTLGPEDSLTDAAARLAEAEISAAPVLEDGVLVGMLSESDLLHAVYRPSAGTLSILDHLLVGRSRRPRRHGTAATVVREAMTPLVFTVAPGESLAAAAATMGRHGVKRLPVLDETGALVGIVSRADLVRAVAERAAPEPAGGTAGGPRPTDVPGVGEVVLEIGAADPDGPAVKRLGHLAAMRALASNPGLQAVRVVTPDGRLLAMTTRTAPAPEAEAVVLEPRRRAHGHVPSIPPTSQEPAGEGQPAGGGRWVRAAVAGLHSHEQAPRPLTEDFDVPQAVLDRLQDPNDLVDLLRATFEAAGLAVRIEDGVVVADGVAVVVVPAGMGAPIGRDLLDRAFRRFLDSGVDSGTVLSLGLMDHSDVLHRELFVPQLGHAGPEAVQAMLDAVAVGGDLLAPVRPAPRPS